jgi:predicted transcriptional regulator
MFLYGTMFCFVLLLISMLPKVSEIRGRRKSLGLTQYELAKSSGILRPSLVKLENGQVDLAYSKVKRIFDELEVLQSQRKSGLIDTVLLGSIHSIPYESLDVGTSLNDVFVKIYETGFSQFVIVDSDRIVGSITDKKVFGALGEFGVEVKDHFVRDYVEDPFPVLSVNTPVVMALGLLQSYQAVLTMEKDEIVGIVTNNDVGEIFIN